MKKIIIVISLIISTFEINKKKDCFQLDGVRGITPLLVIKQKVSHCLGKPIDDYYKEIYTKSGGRFISRIRNDYVVALYWHRYKSHVVQLKGNNIDHIHIASPGKWSGGYAEPGNNVKVLYYDHN